MNPLVNKNNIQPFLATRFVGVSHQNTRPNSYPYVIQKYPVGTMYCERTTHSANVFPKRNVMHRDAINVVGFHDNETLVKNLRLYETSFY